PAASRTGSSASSRRPAPRCPSRRRAGWSARSAPRRCAAESATCSRCGRGSRHPWPVTTTPTRCSPNSSPAARRTYPEGVTDAPHTRRGSVLATAATGVASVALGAGVGELVAGMFTPASSPFAVVGAALIDLAPSWAKDAAIALFGTADKIALLGGILLVVLALGALAGV